MEYVYIYFIMALSGAIMSWVVIFNPVRDQLKLEGNDQHPFVESPIIAMFVWIILSFLAAPFLVPALLLDSAREKFISAVYNGAK